MASFKIFKSDEFIFVDILVEGKLFIGKSVT